MNGERRTGDFHGWLAILVIIGGGGLLAMGDSDLRMVVSSMVTMVLSYYFGSSTSNVANRDTINRMVDVQATAAKALADKVPTPTAQSAGPVDVTVVNPGPVPVVVEPKPKE